MYKMIPKTFSSPKEHVVLWWPLEIESTLVARNKNSGQTRGVLSVLKKTELNSFVASINHPISCSNNYVKQHQKTNGV